VLIKYHDPALNKNQVLIKYQVQKVYTCFCAW